MPTPDEYGTTKEEVWTAFMRWLECWEKCVLIGGRCVEKPKNDYPSISYRLVFISRFSLILELVPAPLSTSIFRFSLLSVTDAKAKKSMTASAVCSKCIFSSLVH